MHNKLVKSIEHIFKLSNRPDLFHIFIDDKRTGGFWRMTITVKPGYEHMIKKIKQMCYEIGSFNGEYLDFKEWNNILVVE